MKRLISLAVGILAVSAGTAAAGPFDPSSYPGQAGSAWSHPPPDVLATVVLGNRATCTMKKCRVTVTCVPSVAAPEVEPCLFILGLTGVQLITRPSLNLAPEEGEEPSPWRAAKAVIVAPGATQTVVLDVVGPGRNQFRNRLRKGKKTLPGRWEANRMGFVEESFGNYGFLYQYSPAPFTIVLPKSKKK